MNYPSLAHYRHTVAEHYAAVRANPDPHDAWLKWRAARDDLIRTHPLSVLEDHERDTFQGIPYADYDPAWRYDLPIDFDVEHDEIKGELPEGTIRLVRAGKVYLTLPSGMDAELTLLWIQGYGGGDFLAVSGCNQWQYDLWRWALSVGYDQGGGFRHHGGACGAGF